MGKKKEPPKSKDNDGEVIDDRFAAATTRPQFRKQREQQSKVVIDDRFASVLTDPRFGVEKRDKYGRSKTKKKEKQQIEQQKAELSEFYTVESEAKKSHLEASDSQSEASSTFSGSSDSDQDEAPEDPASRIAYLTALSRGELSVSSSSDDEPASSEEESDDSDNEDDASMAGILDPSIKEEGNVSLTEEPSQFLAVMNMDWTHVRAVDLFSILSSFTPPGSIRKVQVFPSDFGIERMKKEEALGPSDLWKQQGMKKSSVAIDAVDDEVDASGIEDELEEGAADINPNSIDSDFDPEKLRAYEASKLKYFFAVVEFASAEHADVAYREVDGLELEHSSAAMDMRSIPPNEMKNVVQGRTLRDEATAVPSNYEPPEFVVSALQQTSIQCTWEEGDQDRERKLTAYGNGTTGGWGELADSENLRAYLASDVSSDDDSESDCDKRGIQMRKMLGLDSDGDSATAGEGRQFNSDSDTDDGFSKEASFIPGKQKLEDQIRSKLHSTKQESTKLTPWQKYQEKRKEKKRERRRASRNKNRENGSTSGQQDIGDGRYNGSDGEADARAFNGDDGNDDFFLNVNMLANREENAWNARREAAVEDQSVRNKPSTAEELELLLAGDEGEELAKDYNMRGLIRISKNKDKKLRGSRKRKEEELAANVSGAGFKIDTKDNRFAAVLDGADGRFGIDRTDPSFKETPAMKEIISVQTKRRKAKKSKKKAKVVSDVSAESREQPSGGALALSSLVKSLKSKVPKTVR